MADTQPALYRTTLRIAVGACSLFAACGGGGGHHAATSGSTAAPTTAGSSGIAGVPFASTSTTSSAGPGSTSRHAGSPSTTTGIPPRAGGAGPAPITAGTYVYRQSGTVTYGTQQQAVPTSGTLVADPAKPDHTQVVRRQVSSSQETDFTFSFDHGGIFVLSSTQHSGQTAVTCTLNAPLPVPPWPPASGQTFSGNGTCDYAGETIAVTGSVGKPTANYPVPGVGPRTVWEVDIAITSQGPAQATDTMQELFSPDLRLPVQTTDHVTGSFGVIQFSSVIQSQLVSGPA
jgi:hypothetical protein